MNSVAHDMDLALQKLVLKNRAGNAEGLVLGDTRYEQRNRCWIKQK